MQSRSEEIDSTSHFPAPRRHPMPSVRQPLRRCSGLGLAPSILGAGHWTPQVSRRPFIEDTKVYESLVAKCSSFRCRTASMAVATYYIIARSQRSLEQFWPATTECTTVIGPPMRSRQLGQEENSLIADGNIAAKAETLLTIRWCGISRKSPQKGLGRGQTPDHARDLCTQPRGITRL